METDLFGDKMSSTRQGTDERNSRERRQKQTKACTQIHSCRKWNGGKKEKKIQCFHSELPLRGHPLSHLRGQTCGEGAASPFWWLTRSECDYRRSECFRSVSCIWFTCPRSASAPVLAEAAAGPQAREEGGRHEQCFHKVLFACIALSPVEGSCRDHRLYERGVYPVSQRQN